MKKHYVIFPCILGALSAACLVLGTMLEERQAVQEAEPEYPAGNLSDSLFVSQNNAYTPSEAFPASVAFAGMPYYCDTVDGASAEVGNGRIYSADGTTFIYLSEHSGEKPAEECILGEFPSALLLDYDPAYSYIRSCRTEEGYINGFAAEYYFDMISVSDGKDARTAYMAAYDLSWEENPVNGRIILGVATTGASSEAFARTKEMLDALAGTLRYDEKLAKQQAGEREKEEGAESAASAEAARPTGSAGEASGEAADADGYISGSDADAAAIPISVPEHYRDMVLSVRYENYCADASYALYAPSGKALTEYRDDGAGTVLFEVGANESGAYTLKVTHYSELGTLSVRVMERADGAQEEEAGETGSLTQEQGAGTAG